MKSVTWLLAGALALSACASAPSVSPDSDSDSALNDVRRLKSGTYSSPAWVNEKFTGSHLRKLEDDTLSFTLEQTVHGGGWDTGVAPGEEPRLPLQDVADTESICFNYNLKLVPTGDGKWWAGPKVSVNWAAMTDQPSTGEWYENYVVELANQSPAELEADLFDFFDAEFLGESDISGATYRHIRLRYQEWWQYWSIRQDYRTQGELPLMPILEAWGDIPRDLTYDGVKANIETHGPVSGAGQISAVFSGDNPAKLSKSSYCR